MAERLVLQPPEIVEIDGRTIFLAGPIQGTSDWQTVATKKIHDIDPGIVVASPRKDYPKGDFVYEKQVDWETHYLRVAANIGVIAFWLARQTVDTPGRAYAQTSRFELGEWKMKHKTEGARLIIGIEEGFGNARYIRRRFGQDCPDVEIVDDLDSMCRSAVNLTSPAELSDQV